MAGGSDYIETLSAEDLRQWEEEERITQRLEIATQLAAGIMAMGSDQRYFPSSPEQCAQQAFELADALIAKAAKGGES